MKVDEERITEFLAQDALFARKEMSAANVNGGRGQNVFDQLSSVASDVNLWEYLKEQRSHVPRAYQTESDTNYLTKRIIAAAKSGNRDQINGLVNDMLANWENLGELNIPGDFRWQRDGETGQELIEALVVLYYFHVLFGGERLLQRFPYPEPTEQQLEEFGDTANEFWIIRGITPQRWLAGLGDVPGELGKIVHDRLLNDSLSMGERVELLEKYLHAAEQIYRFLEQGEDFPGQIIDNSRRRFFGNTYRGKLGQIGRIIDSTKMELLQMKNISSAHTAHGFEVRKEA